MTAAAIATEGAAVNVVAPVAIGAGLAGGVFQRPKMAAVTMQIGVRLAQFETGLVVIEKPDQPVVGIVTLGAGGAQRLAVDVIAAVAVDAIAIGRREDRGHVATFAGGDGVLADQREAGQVMVEADPVAPVDLVVARLAKLAVFAVVGVVRPMTTVTVGIDFAAFGAEFEV